MTFEVKEIVKIYIIESPAPKDILDERREGLALSEILKLAGIKNKYYNVVNRETFGQCLDRIIDDLKEETVVGVGVLHFSMHGNNGGIGLTDGYYLKWKELAELLYDFNKKAGFVKPFKDERSYPKISIYMSTCEGFGAIVLNDHVPDPVYTVFIGPVTSVNWSDSLIAYATLYHNTIHRHNGLKAATVKMNEAAGLEGIYQISIAKGLKLT